MRLTGTRTGGTTVVYVGAVDTAAGEERGTLWHLQQTCNADHRRVHPIWNLVAAGITIEPTGAPMT